jgi:hypothetical protein
MCGMQRPLLRPLLTWYIAVGLAVGLAFGSALVVGFARSPAGVPSGVEDVLWQRSRRPQRGTGGSPCGVVLRPHGLRRDAGSFGGTRRPGDAPFVVHIDVVREAIQGILVVDVVGPKLLDVSAVRTFVAF